MLFVWHHARRAVAILCSRPNNQNQLNNCMRMLTRCVSHHESSKKLLLNTRIVKPQPNLYGNKFSARVSVNVKLCQRIRQFQTSARRPINPFLWTLLKPIGKVGAMIWGRYACLSSFSAQKLNTTLVLVSLWCYVALLGCLYSDLNRCVFSLELWGDGGQLYLYILELSIRVYSGAWRESRSWLWRF